MPFDPFAILFWGLMLVSMLLALWGVWRRERRALIISTLLALPFSLLLALYPGARFFIAVPALHALGAIGLNRLPRWTNWLALGLICATVGWLVLTLVTYQPQGTSITRTFINPDYQR